MCILWIQANEVADPITHFDQSVYVKQCYIQVVALHRNPDSQKAFSDQR